MRSITLILSIGVSEIQQVLDYLNLNYYDIDIF